MTSSVPMENICWPYQLLLCIEHIHDIPERIMNDESRTAVILSECIMVKWKAINEPLRCSLAVPCGKVRTYNDRPISDECATPGNVF